MELKDRCSHGSWGRSLVRASLTVQSATASIMAATKQTMNTVLIFTFARKSKNSLDFF